jgi:hypothetical protein
MNPHYFEKLNPYLDLHENEKAGSGSGSASKVKNQERAHGSL